MPSEDRRVLGLRCSNKDYAYAVLQGLKKKPELIENGIVKFPQTCTRVQNIGWFRQEIEDKIARFSISALVIKSAEGLATRGAQFVERVEHEAAAMMAACSKGMRKVPKKVKSTIAKDLGLKGKAAYLATKLDTSVIENFTSFPEKIKEAILVAWSELY